MDLQEGCSRPRGYTADEAKKLMTHIAHVDYENGDSSDDDSTLITTLIVKGKDIDVDNNN